MGLTRMVLGGPNMPNGISWLGGGVSTSSNSSLLVIESALLVSSKARLGLECLRFRQGKARRRVKARHRVAGEGCGGITYRKDKLSPSKLPNVSPKNRCNTTATPRMFASILSSPCEDRVSAKYSIYFRRFSYHSSCDSVASS